MTKSFIIFSLLAIFSAMLKSLFEALGRGKLFSAVLPVVLLAAFYLIQHNAEIHIPSFEISFSKDLTLDSYLNDTEQEIFNIAKEKIGENISRELEKEFKIRILKCEVNLNEENLKIEKISILVSRDDMLVSTYKIKNYIKNAYNADIEVMFN